MHKADSNALKRCAEENPRLGWFFRGAREDGNKIDDEDGEQEGQGGDPRIVRNGDRHFVGEHADEMHGPKSAPVGDRRR